MNITLLHLRSVGALVLISLVGTACSGQKISFSSGNTGQGSEGLPSQLPGPVGPSVQTGCGMDLGSTTIPTKMLFIVDSSESNEVVKGCTLQVGCSDPGKKMRSRSIGRFFSDYGHLTNFSWNFDTFQGTYSTPLINGFGSATAMQNAINAFALEPDWGETPYLAALDRAQATIANDVDLNSSSNPPQYLIVFMSDGEPSDADAPTLLAKVQAIKDLSPSKITFNSIYYGPGGLGGPGLLESMAKIGHGHFLNTNTNPSGLDFAIKDVVSAPCP